MQKTMSLIAELNVVMEMTDSTEGLQVMLREAQIYSTEEEVWVPFDVKQRKKYGIHRRWKETTFTSVTWSIFVYFYNL